METISPFIGLALRSALRSIVTTMVLAVLAILVFAADFAAAETPDTKVLLLRNGQVLSGQISYEGDHYRVTFPTGEIRVRRTEVEHLCRDLVDAFETKRRKIEAQDVTGQMRLADWCIRVELLSQADALISAAEQVVPQSSRVRLSRRNLQLARNPARAVPEVPALEKSPGYSRSELESMTRSMPDGTVETFRKTIQPMLLAGCAAARCHGVAATNDFRLIRPVRGHVLSRRATQRNLQAILRWIHSGPVVDDEADVQGETSILSQMTKSHGTSKESVSFAADSQQVRKVAEWMAALGKPNVGQPPIQFGEQRAALSQALEPDERGRRGLRSERSPRSTSSGPSPDIKDAWDPAIFNRRHHDLPDLSK